jgi:hypothetical protein
MAGTHAHPFLALSTVQDRIAHFPLYLRPARDALCLFSFDFVSFCTRASMNTVRMRFFPHYQVMYHLPMFLKLRQARSGALLRWHTCILWFNIKISRACTNSNYLQLRLVASTTTTVPNSIFQISHNEFINGIV